MTEEEFKMARWMADQGWEFRGTDDAGDMVFVREFAGVWFAADVRTDR